MNEASFFVLKKCENELEAMCQPCTFPHQPARKTDKKTCSPVSRRPELAVHAVHRAQQKGRGRSLSPPIFVGVALRKYSTTIINAEKKKEYSIRVEFELFVDDFGPVVLVVANVVTQAVRLHDGFCTSKNGMEWLGSDVKLSPPSCRAVQGGVRCCCGAACLPAGCESRLATTRDDKAFESHMGRVAEQLFHGRREPSCKENACHGMVLFVLDGEEEASL